MTLTDDAYTLIATNINLNGNVTFSNLVNGLANGTTTISGGCITTGTLSASKITSGTMSANRISGGTIDATDVSIVNLNANNITSGKISANYIDVGDLEFDRIIREIDDPYGTQGSSSAAYALLQIDGSYTSNGIPVAQVKFGFTDSSGTYLDSYEAAWFQVSPDGSSVYAHKVVADNIPTVYYQSSAPTTGKLGDIWLMPA